MSALLAALGAGATQGLTAGIGSAISGLFGGSSGGTNRAEQAIWDAGYQVAMPSWLVKGAQEAGFNPLTLLRAGGGVNASAPVIQSPLSSQGQIAEAMSEGFLEGVRGYDPVADETADLENDLLRQQIERMRNENAMFGVPKTIETTGKVAQRTSASDGAGGGTDQAGNPAVPWEGFDPTVPANRQKITVNDPTGRPIEIWADAAMRVGLTPGDNMMGGEFVENLSEAAEGELIANYGSLREHQTGTAPIEAVPNYVRSVSKEIWEAAKEGMFMFEKDAFPLEPPARKGKGRIPGLKESGY